MKKNLAASAPPDNSSATIADHAPASGPLPVRVITLGFLCSLAFLLYLDRVCIGQATTAIRADLGLSREQLAYVNMAFMVAYSIFELPTGHWGDRHGSRGVIARIVLWWSAFTMLTGAAMGLWSLVVIRFLFGAGEAGGLPNCARVVTKWFPVSERGIARGLLTMSSLVGGVIATALSAWLINRIGWRGTFVVFGLAGVLWAAVFYWWFRDDPAEKVSPAELAKIRGAVEPPKVDHEHHKIPWLTVLSSPNMWLMCATMNVGACLFYMIFQWYPSYLKEARQMSEQSSGGLASLVMAGGAAGCLLGGLFADWLVRRYPDRLMARRYLGSFSQMVAALSVVGLAGSDTVAEALNGIGLGFASSSLIGAVCGASALFWVQFAIPSWWSVVADISGKHGAAMWGLMNSSGLIGVSITTWVVGRLVDHREKVLQLPVLDAWNPVFFIFAALLAGGSVCWLFVNPTRSIVERPAA